MSDYNQTRSLGSRKMASSHPSYPPHQYDPANAPAVVLLDTAKDGLLKVKVESDIMAYILYCHYDEFARIQQTYHVAITWSGLDNTVMFCITSQGAASQLHLATQQFLSFYHHIASNLVAAPLSGHVTNITLHQYHRATYAVKRLHSKAMIKDVKTTGRIALYCPAGDVSDAKRTFISALHSSDSFEDFMETKSSPKPEHHQPQFNKAEKMRKFKTLPNQTLSDKHSKSFSNEYQQDNSLKNPQIRSNSSTVFQQPNYPQYSASKRRQGSLSDDEMDGNFEEKMVRPPVERPRYSEDGSSTSNSSSGYGSNGGTIGRYQSLKERRSRNEYGDVKRQVLPPIPQPQSPLGKRRHNKMASLSRKSPSLTSSQAPASAMGYYYDDIQHSGDPMTEAPSNHESNLNYVKSNYFRHNNNFSPTSMLKHNPIISPRLGHPPRVSPLLHKPSFIPKLESPFRFLQHHKKCFEVTTPLGITVEVHEGDVTNAECDVIVNVTNSQLHVTGELAWAVAKHGSFEIAKLTKLYVAMNGPVMESKVVVTPSIGLPSVHIIHAVAPKWNHLDVKKSKKLLYNTYKNIFNEASIQLGATSIALPIIGLEKTSNKDDTFPFHIAAEVMYQSLITFLKTGSPSLRHIRYIDNDPGHVNLIVTSIKPKIENVTYDSRFVHQHRQNRSLNSQSSGYSDDNMDSSSSPERGMVSPNSYGGNMYSERKPAQLMKQYTGPRPARR